MRFIGLTGGIGSGKSVASKCLQNKGVQIIDADKASRAVVEPGSQALAEIALRFGQSILCEDASLDRKQLRDIIFKSPTEKQWLEALLHPLIRRHILEQMRTASGHYCILESPLLIETRQTELVQDVIVVTAPLAERIKRLKARDGMDEEQIKAIFDSQLSDEQRLKVADYVIENDGSIAELNSKVSDLHARLTG